MSNTRANIELFPYAEYERLFPSRLTKEHINEEGLLQLAVRTNTQEPESFRMPIKVTGLRCALSHVSFRAIILDADLRPASAEIDSKLAFDGVYSSDRMCVTDSNNKKILPTPIGYFLPYDSLEADMFLLESEDLSNRVPVLR